MPDWTVEQWQKADSFLLRVDLDGDGIEEWYSAPMIWDTLPVHHGGRNVLTREGRVRVRVSEDLFQKLRKASEEFVRGQAPKGKPTTQAE